MKIKKLNAILFVLASMLSSAYGQWTWSHGNDISGGDIWQPTRAFEALQIGFSNKLFLGGRAAGNYLSWGHILMIILLQLLTDGFTLQHTAWVMKHGPIL